MRKGWEYKKLGEVATYINGYAFKPDQWKESGTPIIRIQNLNNPNAPYNYFDGEVPEKVKIQNGDLLISWSASLGAYIWNGGKAFLNQHIFKVAFNKTDIDKFFLKYAVTSKLAAMAEQVHGATMKHIVKKDFDNTQIPYPPLSTQLAIVSELDKINELIRLKKEQLKDFDNLAQSLFYEMFGEGKCLRKKLKDIVKIQSGQVSPLEEPYSEMIHVGPANIESNTGRLLNLKTAKEENLISGKYLFNSSMVLYSKIRPNLNKVTIPSFEGICSADMYPIIPLECIDKNFLLFLLKQKEFLTYAISNSGRANIPKINREALLNYEAILPPISLQRLFAQRIEQIEREKSEVQKSIQDLETLLASRMQYWFE